jgi:hypothetical protein
MRASAICIAVLGQVLVANPAFAQQPDADAHTATAFCDFADNQEISVRYNNAPGKDDTHNGKVWLPGGKPLTLFVGAAVSLNNNPIPIGAYSVYVIPNRKEWTLIDNYKFPLRTPPTRPAASASTTAKSEPSPNSWRSDLG